MNKHIVLEKINIMSKFIFVIFLIFSLWFTISYFSYKFWIRDANHRDFYPRWAGVRYLLSGNRNVYSASATRSIQEILYGTTLSANQDQQGFAYPMQLAILLIPFALIANTEVATAIWQGFSFILFLSSLILINQHLGKRPVWLPIFFLFWQYPILMIYQGQMTIIPFVSILLSLVLYSQNKDFLSGLVLSLSVVKPQISLFPIFIFGLVALEERRWDFFKGFILINSILLLISFYIADWWIPEWISALIRYTSYAKVIWPVYEIYRINAFLFFVIIIGVIYSLIIFHNNSQQIIVLSIAIGMLILPQTLNWDLTMIILPIIYSWKGKVKLGVIIIWLLGWGILLFSGYSNWWKIQSICMPLLSICLLVFAFPESVVFRLKSAPIFNKKIKSVFPSNSVKSKF